MDRSLDRRRVSIGAGALALVGLLCWAGSSDDVSPPPARRVVERRREPVPPRRWFPDAPLEPAPATAAGAVEPDGGWRFERDAQGRIVATDGPQGPTRLARDGAGRVVERTDASGRRIRLRFDRQGRAISFESGQTIESLSYDARGRLTQAAAGAERLTYDVEAPAPGLLRARVRDHGAGVTLDYEGASGRARVESPFGTTTWDQDELGRVVQLDTPAGAFTWTHAPDGTVAQRAPNGVVTRLACDPSTRSERVAAEGPFGSVLDVERARDAELRVAAISRDGEVTRFGYDDAGRLVSVDGQPRFAYDAHGGRVREHDVTLEFDVRGRLVRASDGRVFTHDAAGRLTTVRHAAGVDAFEYDPFGRLAAVTRAGRPRVAFTYDPLGRIATRSIEGATTRYVYDGPRLLAELGPGSRRRVYVFGPELDQPLAYRDDARPWTFLHADPLGHVLAYSDEEGARVDRVAFDAWGRLTREPSGDRPVFFAGRLVDRDAGLIHMRARFYDPALGRFLTPDPAGLLGGVNAYAYALNDPLGRVDPLGLWDEVPQWIRQRLRPLSELLPEPAREALGDALTTLWNVTDVDTRESLRRPPPLELWAAAVDRRVSEIARGLEPTSKEYLFLKGELIGLGRAVAAAAPEAANFLVDLSATAIAAGHDVVFDESWLETYDTRSALSDVAMRGELLSLIAEGVVGSPERIAEASRRTGILVEQHRYQEAGEVFGEVVLFEAVAWISLAAGLAEQGVNVARLAPAQRAALLKEALALGYRPGAGGAVVEQVAQRAQGLLRGETAAPASPRPRRPTTGLAQVIDPDSTPGAPAATQVAEAPPPALEPSARQARRGAADARDRSPRPTQGDANRARGPPEQPSAGAAGSKERLSDRGRHHPVPLTRKELSVVDAWTESRARFLRRWSDAPAELPAETTRLLNGSADNAVRNAMTPDDLAAVLKENRGVEILKADGTKFDHMDECLAARDSLTNNLAAARERLARVGMNGGAPGEVARLQERIRDVQRLLDEYPHPADTRATILRRRAERAAAAAAQKSGMSTHTGGQRS